MLSSGDTDPFPGEMITEEIIDYTLYAKEKGCSMQGPEDESLERLNVLKE